MLQVDGKLVKAEWVQHEAPENIHKLYNIIVSTIIFISTCCFHISYVKFIKYFAKISKLHCFKEINILFMVLL